MNKKGLFIVLEGIDGSGTTTQTNLLHDDLKQKSKYHDVLTTHEPWNNQEIKKILEEDKEAYSNGEKLTELYIQDRKNHQSLIEDVLNKRGIVLCDRYHLSTYAYQGVQGISFDYIKKLHESYNIKNPDLTILLDVNFRTAKKRIKKRGEKLEKFEKNKEFTKRLINRYDELAKMSYKDPTIFGPIVKLNGNQSRKKVSEDIQYAYDCLYDLFLEYELLK